MADENKILAYKGMDKDMKCRGFQYEVGKEYEEPNAVLCESGFHACEYPLSVFEFYPPSVSRYFEVEQSGDMKSAEDKTVSTKIKIGAEIGIPELVKAAIEYTKSRCTPLKSKHATGDREAASATGAQGAASATGAQGAASATGYQGAASATEAQGAASATGDQGAASATGAQGAASATGYQGAASATGAQGAASATGYQGAASATGYQGAASATGDPGAASATGAQGAASATGKACVALASGIKGRAKGTRGNAIFLVERGKWDGTTYPVVNVFAGIVDGEKIKENVYYMLKDGQLVEAE